MILPSVALAGLERGIDTKPRAHALGYILPPLWGLDDSS